MLHRYRTAIVSLSLRRCRSVVALLSHRYCTDIAPQLLRCCLSCCQYTVTPLSHRHRSTFATPLSLRCCAAVTPLLHQYRSTVAPLLSLLLSLRSRTAIATVSLHCCSDAVAAAVATQSHRYRTGIAPLSLRCCFSCCRYAVHWYQTVVAPLSNRDLSGPERVYIIQY